MERLSSAENFDLTPLTLSLKTLLYIYAYPHVVKNKHVCSAALFIQSNVFTCLFVKQHSEAYVCGTVAYTVEKGVTKYMKGYWCDIYDRNRQLCRRM